VGLKGAKELAVSAGNIAGDAATAGFGVGHQYREIDVAQLLRDIIQCPTLAGLSLTDCPGLGTSNRDEKFHCAFLSRSVKPWPKPSDNLSDDQLHQGLVAGDSKDVTRS